MNIIHTPVMLNEVISFMPNTFNDIITIDATLGEGGHSEVLAQKSNTLYGIERDKEILTIAKNRLSQYNNIHYINTTYDKIIDNIKEEHIGHVSFILFDLGVSLFHFKSANRGFSFKDESSLDMRLGINDKTAFDVINKYSEKDLADVLFNYGEIKNSRYLSECIVNARKTKEISTAKELENIIFHSTKKEKRYGSIHPATLVFQAIRIEVNDELNILKKALENLPKILGFGGRVVFMSYHSLEDRIVKQYLKSNEKRKNSDGIFKLVNKHILTPSEAEIQNNPPSRSAKVRVAEKVI